jgi:serine/threonine protein kinase
VSPGDYEIEGEVARGGNGRILRARCVHLGRPVAIKELLAHGKPDAVERFVREAMITARLRHPSIVCLHEAGRWPTGEPFYAMQLVSGRSLADVIDDPGLAGAGEGARRRAPAASPRRDRRASPGGPAPFAARLALLPHVIAVADAMAYAHSEGVVHRDLKPDNVLVGKFGETVVIDWGLAKDLRAGQVLTADGAVMGTPAYMPPEQARGRFVDERADVYALGAMLYHVLAGAPPYAALHAPHAPVLPRTVVAGPPPSLAELAPEVPVELATVVGKAMARAPEDRYPSARDLADDLHRYLTGQLVGAHRYTRAELARRFVRRYRALVSVAVAALALGLVLVLVLEWARRSSPSPSTDEPQREAGDRARAPVTK